MACNHACIILLNQRVKGFNMSGKNIFKRGFTLGMDSPVMHLAFVTIMEAAGKKLFTNP